MNSSVLIVCLFVFQFLRLYYYKTWDFNIFSYVIKRILLWTSYHLLCSIVIRVVVNVFVKRSAWHVWPKVGTETKLLSKEHYCIMLLRDLKPSLALQSMSILSLPTTIGDWECDYAHNDLWSVRMAAGWWGTKARRWSQETFIAPDATFPSFHPLEQSLYPSALTAFIRPWPGVYSHLPISKGPGSRSAFPTVNTDPCHLPHLRVFTHECSLHSKNCARCF